MKVGASVSIEVSEVWVVGADLDVIWLWLHESVIHTPRAPVI